MKKAVLIILLLGLFTTSFSQQSTNKTEQNCMKTANPETYLKEIKSNLKKVWPDNKTINLVFHGHSVPAGYFVTPVVNTLESYPYLVLGELKKIYPTAVINIINTAIGGENSINGQKRFKDEVLIHKPDILFIDYALNDRPIGLEKAKEAWEKMIKAALEKNIKVILLTPSPDQGVNILEKGNILEKHSEQIRNLSKKYGIGLADSYKAFKQVVESGEKLVEYMSQVNHPNKKGHMLITKEIMEYFK